MLAALEFRLLGPLTVLVDGAVVALGGTRQQVVLAMLFLEANRVVPVARLIDAVWGDDPPETARNQVQAAVSGLRRRLARRADADVVLSHPAGYSAEVAEESVDVLMFGRSAAEGRAAARRGDLDSAVTELRRGLALWRGDALAGLSSRVLEAAALRLNEQRMAVVEECLELELRLGRHHEVIGELQELVAAHPLREELYANLMLALYRSGRQAEALMGTTDFADWVAVPLLDLDVAEASEVLDELVESWLVTVDSQVAGHEWSRRCLSGSLSTRTEVMPRLRRSSGVLGMMWRAHASFAIVAWERRPDHEDVR